MLTPAELESRATAVLTEHLGAVPLAVGCAPGRVELLGNHTDYNGGLVMSVAIDRYTVAVCRPLPGRDCHVQALDFQESDSFTLDYLERKETGSWSNYVRGVVWALQEALGSTLTSGFSMAIAGDVPLGAGLSSSASLQVSIALGLNLSKLVPWDWRELSAMGSAAARQMNLAQILRRSENEFVGVASGLLDQFSSLFGKTNQALYLDCRTLDFERLPLGDPPPAIIVCDSKTSRRLADGMYNRRRAECETVVAYFQESKGRDAVNSLRDVSLDELKEEWVRLDPVGRKRARHVLTENDRVRRGVDVLKAGDLREFGELMTASHASSRDDFENSSQALDSLIGAAEGAPGFLGGKLSGAGWAGCTVNLVQSDRADDFAESVRTGYAKKTDVIPDIHVCHAAEAFGKEIGWVVKT
jgi:galactokinase